MKNRTALLRYFVTLEMQEEKKRRTSGKTHCRSWEEKTKTGGGGALIVLGANSGQGRSLSAARCSPWPDQ